jgi:hypothetical protein
MRTAKTADRNTSNADERTAVPAGSRSTQSLGKWIDNLMGDSRQRERARKKVKEILEKSASR